MRFVPFIAAIVAGLAQACSIASPWNGQPQWWLQIASLALLAGLLQRAPTMRAAALLAWVFAIAWLAGTWWWLFISMHVYGGLAAPLAAVAVLALASFLALYYAIAGAVFHALNDRWQSVAFAGAWLVAELARGTIFTGFPWGASGYAHVDGPFAARAPFIGVYGIGALAALLAHALATLMLGRGRPSRSWVVPVAAAVLLTACNALTPRGDAPAQRKVSVALLQGNIPQDEKFQFGSGIPMALDWYAQRLADVKAPLVVTPETAIPILPQQLPPGYLEAIQQRFSAGPQAALIGMPLGNPDIGYSNSVVGFAPGAKEPYRYDKHHLVPFGEFIPPFFKWFTRMMNIPLGDFNRGAVTQAPLAWQGERFAPNICYEDLFGEELAQNFTDPARAPTIFVNLSNIGWFGDSVAIDQHLAISRMRAIEFDRPVIRATNTGATAIVDHRGRVTHSLPRLTRGVLTGEVEGRTSMTFYAAWLSRFGLAPLWLLGLACLASAWWAGRREARP